MLLVVERSIRKLLIESIKASENKCIFLTINVLTISNRKVLRTLKTQKNKET